MVSECLHVSMFLKIRVYLTFMWFSSCAFSANCSAHSFSMTTQNWNLYEKMCPGQYIWDNISGTIYPGQYIRDKIRDQWDKSKQGTCYLVRHCINKNNCKQGMVWLDVIGLYTTLYHNDIQPFYQLERSWQDSLIIWSVSSFRKQNQFPLRPELKPLLFLPPLLIDFYLTSLSN